MRHIWCALKKEGECQELEWLTDGRQYWLLMSPCSSLMGWSWPGLTHSLPSQGFGVPSSSCTKNRQPDDTSYPLNYLRAVWLRAIIWPLSCMTHWVRNQDTRVKRVDLSHRWSSDVFLVSPFNFLPLPNLPLSRLCPAIVFKSRYSHGSLGVAWYYSHLREHKLIVRVGRDFAKSAPGMANDTT